jgi:hypothetical protein
MINYYYLLLLLNYYYKTIFVDLQLLYYSRFVTLML